MDISVWLPKGGACKTMMSLLIASRLAHQGRRVLLVDMDPQTGPLMWAHRAAQLGHETPFVVAAAKSRGFDDVIYDHAPVPPEAGLPGQLVVMPTLLDATTHPLYRRGVLMLETLGMPYVAIPNRVRLDRAEQRQLQERAFADVPFIKDRAVHPRLFGLGKTIFEDTNKNNDPARQEVITAVDYILSRYPLTNDMRIAA